MSEYKGQAFIEAPDVSCLVSAADLVGLRKSFVPPYMLQDVSYVIGHLYQRFKEKRDWKGFAERLQSYLLGRYADPHGGSWNVLVQEGSFLVTRLWIKHNRFFRVEIDPPEDPTSALKSCVTVVCFEACTSPLS